MKINYLKSVFWDYPDLNSEESVHNIINSGNSDKLKWVLSRFLEHGRVIDTLTFFNIKDISKSINELKLKKGTREKWNRLIEVYGKD
ncbi:MAG: hypothetical protein K8I03_07525 [Ignavibacteria bacterium]|nr:hypothetical protein [Ignavibacteria bacterium]